ncbi:MAG: YfhO family protein, partial [Flavobacteriaceae bacterium]
IPTYWGAQPILEAPAYIGISVFFFALLALIYLRSPIRNALLVTALFSLALSWGKNFSLLTGFFIDYIPLYNKFRAVSSIQVLLELCFPVLAALGLHWALQKEAHFDFKKFVNVVGIPILFLVALLLFQGSFSFSGPNDAYLNEIYGADFMSVIRKARRSIFREDVIRALLFIVVLAVLIAYYQLKKGNQKFILIASIGIVLFDLLGVSSRYLSRAAFVEPARAAIPFQLTEADRVILQDSSRYRVFEPQLGLTGARTAYFHNTLGGYHGAKPRRFEELYNYYSTNQIAGILDFLNIKYFLVPDSETNTLQALVNPNALGPAWTIANLKTAPTADDLLESLKTTDFSNEAVVLEGTFPTDLAMSYSKDTLATLTITESKPDSLVYEIETGAKQFVVFSEMYYPHGWTASVNGVNTPIVNVNYVLRGLEVPEGKSRIVFHFEPEVVRLGTQLRWTTLILFIVFLGGLYYFQKRNQNQAN